MMKIFPPWTPIPEYHTIYVRSKCYFYMYIVAAGFVLFMLCASLWYLLFSRSIYVLE